MLFLGVDGGSSKTDFCLCDEQGGIHARALLPGCNLMQTGKDGFSSLMRQGLTQCCAAAGVDPHAITSACFCVTAYGESEDAAPVINSCIGALLARGRFVCQNDTAAAYAGSLAARPGIHIISGTGSIAYGVDPSGASARAGGWSCVFCDEGSCHWLGRQAVALFTRQSDGRLARSPLYHRMREEYGLVEDLHLCRYLNDVFYRDRAQMARVQLVLRRAYDDGDPHAAQLYAQAARELAQLAGALLDRLCFPAGGRVALSYSGGLFENGGCILTPFKQALSPLPVSLRTPAAPPIAGAALLALLHTDASADRDAFLARLKRNLSSSGG